MTTWPQYTVLSIMFGSLVLSMVADGKPRQGTYSAGSAVAAIVIEAFLLWRGGFFTPLGVAP